MEPSQGFVDNEFGGLFEDLLLPSAARPNPSFSLNELSGDLGVPTTVEVKAEPPPGKCSRPVDESGLYPLAKAPRPIDFDPYAPFDREEKPLLASPTARADDPKFRTAEPSSLAGAAVSKQPWRQPPSRWPTNSAPQPINGDGYASAAMLASRNAGGHIPQAPVGFAQHDAGLLSSSLPAQPWGSPPAKLQGHMCRGSGNASEFVGSTGQVPPAGFLSSTAALPGPWPPAKMVPKPKSRASSRTASAPAGLETPAWNSHPGAMGRAEAWDEALPVAARGGAAGTSAAMSDLEIHREKNRLAQTRFRARRKNQIQESERQLQELSVQMEQLMRNNAFLQSRAAINRHLLGLRFEQLEKLQINHAVREYEMNLLIEDVADFMSSVEERTITPAEAKDITLHEWMTLHFQTYIDRLKRLLPAAKKDPGGKEERQLEELVNMRREHEGRVSMASSLYWAIFAWNYQEHMPTQPTEETWARLLDGLELTGEQEQRLMESRQRMFHRLQDVCTKRQEATSSLGFALLTTPKENLMDLEPAKALQETLIGEHEAVFEFLFTVADEVLTPLQEAYLDSEAYPWWPDIWIICNLLAKRRNHPPAPSFEDLRVKMDSLENLLPFISPFWVLQTPMSALGCGLRLKRSMLAFRYFTVTPVLTDGHIWVSIPDRKELHDMTIFDVHWGKFHNAWKLMANGMAALTPGERAQEEAKKASYHMHLRHDP